MGVIEDFYAQLNGKVAVSFSGGKDSTVLYWLARKLFPDIKAVFCNTGNEYPDIVKFVRGMKNDGYNIDIIYPEMKPCEVIAEYGFPLISKETAQRIWYTKHKPDSQVAKIGRGEIGNGKFRVPKKYLYLVDAEYDVTPKCCDILKKHPFDKYRKEHGVNFFIGTMASESMNRTTSYLRQGSCNHYDWKDMRRTKSLPLSIWTEEISWSVSRDITYQLPRFIIRAHRGLDVCSVVSELSLHTIQECRWYMICIRSITRNA